MNEEHISFSENELSEDDLAVLRAFETMDDELVQSSLSTQNTQLQAQDVATEFSFEDMLLIFVAEADKDIKALCQALKQIEQDSYMPPERFEVFRSRGHKIRGSAGFVDCHSIVRIAQYIEDTARRTMQNAISPEISLKVLTYAISALETTFQEVVATGEEIALPLTILEEQLKTLPLDEEDEKPDKPVDQQVQVAAVDRSLQEVDSLSHLPAISTDMSSALAYMSIDAHRFADLLYHSEQLEGLRTPLESALEQVKHALQELRVAQNQLTQLESRYFTFVTTPEATPLRDEIPTSSLMARILSKAGQRSDPSSHASYKERNKFRSYALRTSEAAPWDELDMEHYSEKYLLLNSLREAVAEVNAASSHVQVAFAHLHLELQEYTSQATTVHKDTLVLRLVPLSNIVSRLQGALMAAEARIGQRLKLEVKGATTEIDQQILEALSIPLEQLLRTCWVDRPQEHKEEPARIWLYAQERGNDIVIEVGFSVTVSVGAVDPLREIMQRLGGTLSPERNETRGVSFHLRLPRSQGTMHCLIVRTGNELMIVPFAQIQRIGDSKREDFNTLYNLRDLINCTIGPEISSGRIQPVLVLLQRTSPFSVGVTVDEVVEEVELLVKPLPSYLQRPGLTNGAIDGTGRVLLMPDMPELIINYTQRRYNSNNNNSDAMHVIPNIRRTQAKILLADDSVVLRNTLVQMLKHADYFVLEARDGLEALEQLIQHVPDVFLLDVEMPNLNGYDLMGIMRLYPSLAAVKIIMLTSRSSPKHVQHAMDLGAHAYLTKPCSQEVLVETIQKMLQA
jgi:chemosensory pili system protein ChpA (sensor histidine kinase/response regulator)